LAQVTVDGSQVGVGYQEAEGVRAARRKVVSVPYAVSPVPARKIGHGPPRDTRNPYIELLRAAGRESE